MKANPDTIEKRFLEDIKDHKLNILKDDEVYRHLRVSRKDSWTYGYDIITFPGGLLITGDMGTYEFERTKDMFCFFRNGVNDDGSIKINSGYWGEKCRSQSLFGDGIREFDYNSYEEYVTETFNGYFEDYPEEEYLKEDVWEEVQDQLLDCEMSESECYRALFDFSLYSVDCGLNFEDSWEVNFKTKTHHFIWCLYAIVYAIKLYDKEKDNGNL